MSGATSNSWPRYRPPHRRRADEAIRADAQLPPPAVDHPLVPAGEPELVQTDAALSALLRRLRDAGRFAYDAEFIGEQTFYPKFCVIQVGTADHVALIDPLAELDVLPFWKLLTDASVQKVVHAGQQDLEPTIRLTGQPARNVYDTQIAAAFTGRPYPLSLTKLVTEVCDADLGSDHKFSTWDRRPLTPTQLAYAANDVRYLLLLRHELDRAIDTLGHRGKADAEFAAAVAPEAFRSDPLAMKLRARGAGRLRRRQQAVCDALRRWRYEQAERKDIPVRALIDDQALLDLARCKPETPDAVRQCKGVPRPVKERYADDLAALTRETLAGELPPRRHPGRSMSDAARETLDALWPAVREHCEQRSICPSIVLSKRELTELVRARDEGRPTPDNRLTEGWRAELLRPVLGDLLD